MDEATILQLIFPYNISVVFPVNLIVMIVIIIYVKLHEDSTHHVLFMYAKTCMQMLLITNVYI